MYGSSAVGGTYVPHGSGSARSGAFVPSTAASREARELSLLSARAAAAAASFAAPSPVPATPAQAHANSSAASTGDWSGLSGVLSWHAALAALHAQLERAGTT